MESGNNLIPSKSLESLLNAVGSVGEMGKTEVLYDSTTHKVKGLMEGKGFFTRMWHAFFGKSEGPKEKHTELRKMEADIQRNLMSLVEYCQSPDVERGQKEEIAHYLTLIGSSFSAQSLEELNGQMGKELGQAMQALGYLDTPEKREELFKQFQNGEFKNAYDVVKGTKNEKDWQQLMRCLKVLGPAGRVDSLEGALGIITQKGVGDIGRLHVLIDVGFAKAADVIRRSAKGEKVELDFSNIETPVFASASSPTAAAAEAEAFENAPPAPPPPPAQKVLTAEEKAKIARELKEKAIKESETRLKGRAEVVTKLEGELATAKAKGKDIGAKRKEAVISLAQLKALVAKNKNLKDFVTVDRDIAGSEARLKDKKAEGTRYQAAATKLNRIIESAVNKTTQGKTYSVLVDGKNLQFSSKEVLKMILEQTDNSEVSKNQWKEWANTKGVKVDSMKEVLPSLLSQVGDIKIVSTEEGNAFEDTLGAMIKEVRKLNKSCGDRVEDADNEQKLLAMYQDRKSQGQKMMVEGRSFVSIKEQFTKAEELETTITQQQKNTEAEIGRVLAGLANAKAELKREEAFLEGIKTGKPVQLAEEGPKGPGALAAELDKLSGKGMKVLKVGPFRAELYLGRFLDQKEKGTEHSIPVAEEANIFSNKENIEPKKSRESVSFRASVKLPEEKKVPKGFLGKINPLNWF